jgi:hypothetical protein
MKPTSLFFRNKTALNRDPDAAPAGRGADGAF